jgi:hypothetical protein
MSKETSTQSGKISGLNLKAAQKPSKESGKESAKEMVAKAKAILPPDSWQRVSVGVAAAAAGGLLAAAAVGVGPAAIAGAAGYLAYRGMSKKENPGADLNSRKH